MRRIKTLKPFKGFTWFIPRRLGFRCFRRELKVTIGFARPGFNPISRAACERARKFMRQKGAQQPEIIFEAQRVGRECASEGLTREDALFVVGALKTLITGRSWWRSGFESMAIGIAAAAVTYGAGVLFASGRGNP